MAFKPNLHFYFAFLVRLLVPSKSAGSIIGKGGQNIQKLRTEFNANIRVPDCPGPERVMTVQADNPEIIASVLEQTVPVLTEEAMRGGGGGGGANQPPPKVEEGGGPVLEARLLIHQSIVGGIIGRAGFKIKEIRDASGANIKVYQTCAPQSTDRCVAVHGSLFKMIRAMKEVFEVISNTEIKGVDQPYDPINFDGYYAAEYGGYGTEMDVYGGPPRGLAGGGLAGAGMPPRGGGGMGGPPRGGLGGGRGRGGSQGGFRGGFGGGGFGGNSGGAGGFGNRGGGGGGAGFNNRYEVGYNNVDVMSYTQKNNGGGNNFNNGAGGPPPQDISSTFSASSGEDNGEQETTQVTIPKDMAGAIIGPGGSRIRKIRSDSKASITIDEPVQGSNERIITITGTQRQIQTAQFLLQQSVREHAGPPQMGYGGPPARY